jgi:hypothetical protein
LAIVAAVKNFATYLRFVTFETVSDHQPLAYLFKGKNKPQTTNRLLRWAMFLNSYDFTIRFASGDSTEIRHTDWLSRESFESPTDEDKMRAREKHPNQILQEEMACPECVPQTPDDRALVISREKGVQTNLSDLCAHPAAPKPQRVRVPRRPRRTWQQPTEACRTKDAASALSERDENKEIPYKNKVISREDSTEHLHKNFPFQAEDAIDEDDHIKRVANYMLPYRKIHSKLDRFTQNMYPREKIIEKQSKDEFGSQMLAYLVNNELPRCTRTARYISVLADQFFIRDDILYHIEIPSGGRAEEVFRMQMYLPDTLRDHVAQELHLQMHLSTEKLVQKLKLSFWWPKMFNLVQRVVDNCEVCQADKKMRSPYRAPLKSPRVPNGPAQCWYLDHFGPIKIDKSSKSLRVPKYVLLAVDAYSLYTEIIPVTSTDSKTTARALIERVIGTHSFPVSLRHDRGAAFTSKILEKLTQGLSIKRYVGAAMSPRTQGCVEARVKIVSTALRRLTNSRQESWHHHLPAVQLALNSTPTRQTGLPPFLLQHGRCAREPVNLAFEQITRNAGPHREHLVQLARTMKVWRATALRSRQQYRDYMKKIYDRKVNVPQDLMPGELVYMACPFLNVKHKGIKRLNIPCRGPFVIIERVNDHLCRLARMSDLVELPNLVSVTRLRLTNYGIDPPAFEYDADLDPDTYGEVIPREVDINQPWDEDWSQEESDNGVNNPDNVVSGDDNEPDPAPNVEVIPGDITRNNLEENRTEEPGERLQDDGKNPVPTRVPVDRDNDNESNGGDCRSKVEDPEFSETASTGSNDLCEDVWDVAVRMPPKIRTTRSGSCQTGPEYRSVVKICGRKVDRKGQEWLRVLYAGDKPGRTFWVERKSLCGEHVQRMIDECMKKKGESSNKIMTVLHCVKQLWR